jgi:hypothetical protein
MSLEQLRAFAAAGYLYAILDPCDAPGVPPKMEELGERAVSLFRGYAEEQYTAVAPYLVAVDPPTLEWIVETLWKEPWGIFVMAKADLDTLRQHFRRFLIVQLPDGEKWFFRYYDPRILRVYLPNCNDKELRKFYGPLRAFAIADAEQDTICSMQLRPGSNPDAPSTEPAATLLWLITPAQYAALSQDARRRFEDLVIAHLKEFFPERCRPLKEPDLRAVIDYGVKHAAVYNIVSEQGVCTYIDLMFLFGKDFDKHPQLPWACQVLTDPSIDTPETRVYQLRLAAQAHLQEVAKQQ